MNVLPLDPQAAALKSRINDWARRLTDAWDAAVPGSGARGCLSSSRFDGPRNVVLEIAAAASPCELFMLCSLMWESHPQFGSSGLRHFVGFVLISQQCPDHVSRANSHRGN